MSAEPADAATGFTFRAYGVPAPQGSTRAYVVKGRAHVTADNKRTKPWRQDMIQAILDAYSGPALTGPLRIIATFLLPRPKSHYRTGGNAHLLRDTAPTHPTGKPDLDKLLRSLLDALTDSGAIVDDSQVAFIDAAKLYPQGGASPGVYVHVRPLT